MMYSPRFSGLAKPGLGPAAELLFGIAQKVTKKASPTPRLLRAPQEKVEYWGRLLLVTFLGEARKVTGPARPRSALVADIKHHSVKPFDKLRANGSSAVVAPQSTLACINLRWVETHPTNSHWHRAATERAVRAGALPC